MTRIERETAETKVRLAFAARGEGKGEISTGVGFFDHMLTLFAKHGRFDLVVDAKGDLEVDAHHLVEDVGICLGKALKENLGSKENIRRYGHSVLPMDECLVLAAVDLGGRSFLGYHFPSLKGVNIALGEGGFVPELAEEFWQAFAANGRLNLHLRELAGGNIHHLLEASFKAAARAIRMAVEELPGEGIPSTKGIL
ncbi:MAG: imidazoleglycerol-phosphate dehydratase HisB [Firmicutes bacterium]|jgi:imidazoleglycerol-phosphate dehydratase|nr:imidazoleglycerol-phosphate dehydratase HisB [Bacillota bacterium]